MLCTSVNATFQRPAVNVKNAPRSRRANLVVRAAAAAADEVPSPEKRTIMNLLLAGAIGLPVRRLRSMTWFGSLRNPEQVSTQLSP